MLSHTVFSVLLISNLITTTVIQTIYTALKSDSLEQIELAMEQIAASKPISRSNAYKGALTMKKASFMKTPKQKISTFKKGHQLLETEITAQPNNAEYRFLRLLIQENAPKILKYNKNLDEDKKIVIDNYSSFSPFLQSFIAEYSEESTILTSSDLN